MTLKFFRRKSASGQRSSVEKAAEQPAPAAKRSTGRRRRGGTGASGRAGAPARSVQEPEVSGTAGKTSTGRTRRGRRGGAGRKAAAAKAAPAPEAAPAREPAPVTPLRPKADSVEALLLRQETTLEHFAEQQLTVLRSLQGSLSAIENRLAGVAVGGERPRLGIFVDVPNVMYAAERLRVTLDFGKMLQFLTRGRELVRASAYAPISDDPQARLDTQKFVQPFVGYGYRLVTKPHKRYADGSMKANFDVELAIDVLAMSDRLDVVALVSGDGDFRRLVELIASKGVRVEVVAFGNSTAAELRAIADEYIDLSDHLTELRLK